MCGLFVEALLLALTHAPPEGARLPVGSLQTLWPAAQLCAGPTTHVRLGSGGAHVIVGERRRGLVIDAAAAGAAPCTGGRACQRDSRRRGRAAIHPRAGRACTSAQHAPSAIQLGWRSSMKGQREEAAGSQREHWHLCSYKPILLLCRSVSLELLQSEQKLDALAVVQSLQKLTH